MSSAERGRATIVSLTERSETEGIPPYQLRVAKAQRAPIKRFTIRAARCTMPVKDTGPEEAKTYIE